MSSIQIALIKLKNIRAIKQSDLKVFFTNIKDPILLRDLIAIHELFPNLDLFLHIDLRRSNKIFLGLEFYGKCSFVHFDEEASLKLSDFIHFISVNLDLNKLKKE